MSDILSKEELEYLRSGMDVDGRVPFRDCRKLFASHDLLVETLEKLGRESLALQIEMLTDAFLHIAHKDPDGWYDTMALSAARDAGDRLVELGVFEKSPEGYGRRQFYRFKESSNE